MAVKLMILLCLAVGIASGCGAPGTTTTTTTTSTTTVSSSEGDEGSLVSSSDRSLIRRSWEQAKKDGDVAPKILLQFLKAHPEYQKKFKSLAGVAQDDLINNGNFLAQAFTILGGLNVVIQSMGSQELLSQEIQQLGGAHEARGVSATMFEEFGGVVLTVLEEELGSIFSDDVKQAWQRGIRALNAGIAKNLMKKEDLAHPLTHLTPRQIKDVQGSWQSIRGDRNSIVSDIFIKIFKETPRSQKSFAKFADLPADSLPGNADFEKQAALVADRLDNMIATAGDTLQIVGQINYMAYSHKDRNIGLQRFEDFSRLLLESLTAKGVSADDLDSWRGTLSVLIHSIDKLQKQ